MLDHDTLTKLRSMRLSGFADCLERLDANAARGLSTAEVIRLATDEEWERRRNTKLARLRTAAHLAQPHADLSDLRQSVDRNLDIELINRLATGTYLARHHDIILQGPTGAGKTFIACALGNRACQQYKTVRYYRANDLFDEITIADRNGEKGKLFTSLIKLDLLIIDDWFLTAPTREQVQQLHVLIDRRTTEGAGSTIYCTQLQPAQWHDRMEEKILADAIIDRITAGAQTITVTCTESMRRHFGTHPHQ